MRGLIRKGEWLSIPLSGDEASSYEEVNRQIQVPLKYWNRLKSRGDIKSQGGRLLLRLFPEQSGPFVSQWGDVDIVYEDDWCLVVNKPAGIAVHPASPDQVGTLGNQLASYYEMTGQACRVRHIHRLDADTTGLVLYAKNELAQLHLDEAMRQKTINRTYLAIAEGHFTKVQGTIDAPIGKDRHTTGKRRVSTNGDAALTHYRVIEQMKDAALVEVELETGRTHQIRVHISYLGHPLIGDRLYGGNQELLPRQALHGYKLSFEHPITSEAIELECPIPSDLQELYEGLSASGKM
ncbi:RluA family pseudouridine synthase [Paenibacillus sp. N1-5-1-14]|uniref:RluA family pseudouridine synthase n=1 Tax=Paenibacillus radicibacter TaxID=2972488 RepID=UPI0021596870|nr:RluA family pseudouridine synthase [Paenibacillus radicibacter]MCR8644168.1 RluA family pseudouridine synthase [Paenibacillus radicibacter]